MSMGRYGSYLLLYHSEHSPSSSKQRQTGTPPLGLVMLGSTKDDEHEMTMKKMSMMGYD